MNYVRRDVLEQGKKERQKRSYLIESKIKFRLKNRGIRKFGQESSKNCRGDI